MTINNRMTIQISAESRALIRAAIRASAGWQAYKSSHLLDLSDLTTRDAIFDCCDALHIDVAAVIAAGPVDAEKLPAPRGPRLGATLLDTPPPERAPVVVAPKAAPAPIAAPSLPADAAAQLLGLIQSLAPKATMDEPAIRAVVAHEMQGASAALMQLVAAALENVTTTRIELKAGATVTALDGTHHPKFATLLRAMSAKQADGYAPNIWLAGPAGSGKTYAAKSAAKALGVAFHYNGALSMPHELLGFIDAGGTYHRTPFREAYEHGGAYLFDEVDGSDNSALLALNAALANGTATFPDGQISRHADTYIIAAANTWGLGATAEYVGRSKIDAAFLSRFPVRIGWDYDEKLERQISGNKDFARRVQKARAAARKAGLKVLIDPRASIAGAALIAQGFTETEAAELTYLANLTADQHKIVEA